MANTKPKPPYEQQESFALVDELCVELRSVGGVNFASALSDNSSYAIEYVNNVKEIHRADSDTLLGLGDTEQERDFPNQIVGYCEVCITEELAKRRQDASP